MQVCRKHFWCQRKGKHWWAHSFGQGYFFKIHLLWQCQFDRDVNSEFMLLCKIWGNPIPIGFAHIPIMTRESYPDSFTWDSDFAYSRTQWQIVLIKPNCCNDATHSVDCKTEEEWKIFFLQEKSKLVQNFKFLWGCVPASKGAYHSGFLFRWKQTFQSWKSFLKEDSVYFGC